jgi:MFS family permease
MVGRTFGVLGSQVVSTTAGWQLYERTGDPWYLGLVGLVELLPVLVLILPAGQLADRKPRRDIAVLAHLSLTFTALGLAIVSAFDGPDAAIYALLASIGAARAFAAPSVGTIMPQLLPPDEYARANAWLSSSLKIATVSGPAVGGLLIELGGPTLAYSVATTGHLVFCTLLLIFVPRRVPTTALIQKGTPRELLAGLRFIRRNRMFLGAITLDLFAVLLGGATALLPVFAKDVLHVGPAGLGWLRAAPGLGAAVMAVIIARSRPYRRPGRIMFIAVVGFGLATVGFGLSENFAFSFICLFFTGVFDEISVLIRQTLEQIITPDRLRGRVSSVNHIFIGFSNQLGAFESGAVAALIGSVGSVVVGGIGSVLVALTIMRLFPELVRLGPLESLTPDEDSVPDPNQSSMTPPRTRA